MTGCLTVRENLFFSASLRLPSSMSMRERKSRVQKVIDELRLNSCADRKVWFCFVMNYFVTIFYLIFSFGLTITNDRKL